MRVQAVPGQSLSMLAAGERDPLSTRYGAAWRAESGTTVVGGLDIGPSGLRLHGAVDGDPLERTVAYSEIRGLRIGRLPAELLRGRPTLLLDLGDATLQVEPLGMGLLHEVTNLLAGLAAEAEADAGGEVELAVVVLPLRAGALEEARALLAEGPPFDPSELDLDEHEVFVSESEVVFFFRGRRVRVALERASRDPKLWRAGLAWRRLLGGRPRLLETEFRWSRMP